MPAGLHLLELAHPPKRKTTLANSKVGDQVETSQAETTFKAFVNLFSELIFEKAESDWLILWPFEAKWINAEALHCWLEELKQAEPKQLVSFPCLQIIEQNDYHNWISPRPYPALPWLYQQNPLGGIVAVRSSLLKRLDLEVLKKESSIEGFIHALWLHLLNLEPLKPEQVLRSNNVVCKLSLKNEQRFYYPNEGLAERVKHFSGGAPSQFKVRLHDKANQPAYVSPHLTSQPLVSILIPFRNQPKLLRQCLDSILEHGEYYPDFEVIGIDNQTCCPDTLALMRHYSQLDSRIRFIIYDEPFNFSAINNLGAKVAQGEHLVLMNNDIQVLTPDWLPQLLTWSSLPDTGFVGAKLYYPNDTTQHTGCTLGLFGHVDHSFKHRARHKPDPWHWTSITRNVTCVTAAMAMIKKSVYEAVGGFDETNFVVLHNDMDLSLKVHEAGYKNLVVGSCEAYHHESVSLSCNKLLAVEQNTHRQQEMDRFLNKYKHLIEQGDPFFSPYLNHYDLANHPTNLVLDNYHQEAGGYKRLLRTRLPLCGKTASLVRLETANKGRQYRLLVH